MSEAPRPRRLPVPPPMDAQGAHLDARIRDKTARGLPLDDEERAFLARMPADKAIPADVVREAAREDRGAE